MTLEDLENSLKEILERLDRMERLLLASIPCKKLPPDLQQKAFELLGTSAPEVDPQSRISIAKLEFEKLARLESVARQNYKFPREIIPTLQMNVTGDGEVETPLDIVPLSLLLNRLTLKGTFYATAGEISPRDNARQALKDAGLFICTLHDARLRQHGTVEIIMTQVEAVARGLKGARLTIIEDEFESVRQPLPEVSPEFVKEGKRLGLVSDAPVHTVKMVPDTKHPEIMVESFETSDAAAGLAGMQPIDEPFRVGDWDEDEQPEHHPFEDFNAAGALEQAAKPRSSKKTKVEK